MTQFVVIKKKFKKCKPENSQLQTIAEISKINKNHEQREGVYNNHNSF